MKPILSEFRIFFLTFVSRRTSPASKENGPVTIADMKDMHDALVKHMSSNNFCKTDLWNGQKQRKEQYSFKFVAAAKILLQNHLKANDFLEAPKSFDEHKSDWFNANVE